MANDTPTLKATRRERLGTRYARRDRKAGGLPAVIYGHKTDPVAILLDEKQTLSLLHHGAHVINVQVEGGATETCLVKELQFGFLGDNVIHVDLTRVDLDEEVQVSVHLRFIGTPEAAKKPGTIVHYEITELPVRCKVRDIPGDIRVDIGGMGESMAAKELTLPAGVTLDVAPTEMIARIETVLDVADGEAAAVEGAGAGPEVITERKVDGEGGDAGKEKKA